MLHLANLTLCANCHYSNIEKEKEKQKHKKLKAEKQVVPKLEPKPKPEKKIEKVKEVKIFYNERKTDRKRALKRAEHEDPVFERVKQAWDISQRNRVVNAILRFGFGRFCKVRQESNFTSLPIQDIEVFARTCESLSSILCCSFIISHVYHFFFTHLFFMYPFENMLKSLCH